MDSEGGVAGHPHLDRDQPYWKRVVLQFATGWRRLQYPCEVHFEVIFNFSFSWQHSHQALDGVEITLRAKILWRSPFPHRPPCHRRRKRVSTPTTGGLKVGPL